MRPDVQRDTERLRSDAVRARHLSDVLQELLRERDRPAVVDPAHAAELERLETAVRRVARELAELGAALSSAAAIRWTDDELASALRNAEGRP